VVQRPVLLPPVSTVSKVAKTSAQTAVLDAVITDGYKINQKNKLNLQQQ
jgi:hypothetical protein